MKTEKITRVALCPMAGITDSAFRLMNKLSGVDLVYSEMAHVNAISHNNKKTFELLKASPFEFPYVVQFFGNDPKYFAEAARIISTQGVPVVQYKPFSEKQQTFIKKLTTHNSRITTFYSNFLDFQKNIAHYPPALPARLPAGQAGRLSTDYLIPSGLDINLGCPAKRVCGHGSGAALWRDLSKIRLILEAVSKNTKLPVSIKVRTAVGEVTVLDLLEYLKDLPLKRVMIHGRSLEQGFSGPIDTRIINKAIKKYPQFEFWVNGGIIDSDSANRIIKETGCPNLGIARGTYGNPLLAEEIKWSVSSSQWVVDNSSLLVTDHCSLTTSCIIAYIHSVLAHQSKGKKGIFEMRKHLAWYFKDFPGAKTWRKKLVGVKSLKEIEKIFIQILR